MAIVSNPTVLDVKYYFIFFENSILLNKNNLPSKRDFEFFINQNLANDYFTESNLSYAALDLKKDFLISDEYKFIHIRQFFFEQKELSFLSARALSITTQRKSFKFCPTCASSLIDDETESAKRCPACNKKFFPKIEPATITLISKGNKILLVKNKNSAYKNFACVSGFVEQGESLEQCVAREIKEETNIEVQNIKYCGSQAWPFPDQLMLAFTADYKSGDLKIQESEILDAAWFDKDALPPEEELPRAGSVAWNLINGRFKA